MIGANDDLIGFAAVIGVRFACSRWVVGTGGDSVLIDDEAIRCHLRDLIAGVFGDPEAVVVRVPDEVKGRNRVTGAPPCLGVIDGRPAGQRNAANRSTQIGECRKPNAAVVGGQRNPCGVGVCNRCIVDFAR